MVCSLFSAVLPRFDHDAASLHQATVVNYFVQMLSFGRIQRSCSVPPTVPVHVYELGAAGTLFANNQRCRNAVPLRPKAL